MSNWRERIAMAWNKMVFGDLCVPVRVNAMRMIEEAIEVGQVLDVAYYECMQICAQVYSRKVGDDARKELGAVILCAAKIAHQLDTTIDEVFADEMCRVMDPAIIERVRRRNLAGGDKIGLQ